MTRARHCEKMAFALGASAEEWAIDAWMRLPLIAGASSFVGTVRRAVAKRRARGANAMDGRAGSRARVESDARRVRARETATRDARRGD